MQEVYERLRAHLDSLPAGFPATEEGIELRLLSRLFSPEEAALACHVTMELASADQIAAGAGLTRAETADRLEKMSRKGLIFSIEAPDRPPVYMASQYVVGIWEYHVNDLDEPFVRDNAAYFPTPARQAFDHLPQLRTIPVNRSVDVGLEVMPHERAAETVKQRRKFAVAPCICRREHQLLDGGCGKSMEACLVFDWAADDSNVEKSAPGAVGCARSCKTPSTLPALRLKRYLPFFHVLPDRRPADADSAGRLGFVPVA